MGSQRNAVRVVWFVGEIRPDRGAIGEIGPWKGKVCVVVATAEGFEYNGQLYKSLSGAAFAITGTQWNGKKFFGVK